MGFPHSKSSLFAEIKRKQSGHGWDMLGKPQPLAFKHHPDKHALLPTPTKTDSTGNRLFNESTSNENQEEQNTTEIEYEAITGSVTPIFGGCLIFLSFKIKSADGKYTSNFKGHIRAITMGVGFDVSGTIGSGTLKGPYIPWHKKAVLNALDNKTSTGKGFTFAFINGVTIDAEFKIGDYTDPSFSFEVEGVSVGWEGFRGTLYIDHDSFSIIKN